MRFLVTGASGQLGYDCVRTLRERGFCDVVGIDFKELDITHRDRVLSFFDAYMPDVVIHCAGYTSVDKAEKDMDNAYLVNAVATKYIAEAAEIHKCKMVYISTDYVFDGKDDGFYETYDPPRPISSYGKSKFDGEKYASAFCTRLFIVRISWAFGKNGSNFVKTMIDLGSKNKVLDIVSDQVGSPTYTRDLSGLLIDMVLTEKYGTYHATNEGVCSWAEFAREIFRIINIDVVVNSITTAEYLKRKPEQAVRPLNSKLSKSSLDAAGFERLPTWQNALARFIEELKL